MNVLQHPIAGILHVCAARKAPYDSTKIRHTTQTNLDHQSTQKTKEIYSKHHRMATHHWIIICGIENHVQVGYYSGVRESGLHKRDEDGDEEGDVDEDDHHGDGSPGGTPAPPGERGR